MSLRRSTVRSTIGVLATAALSAASASRTLNAQAPGALDPAYGDGDGIRILEPHLSPDAGGNVWAAAAGPDGRLWVAGDTSGNGDIDSFVCRVLSDGGAHSCLVIDFDLVGGGSDGARAVAVGADGKAVVAGHAAGPVNDPDKRAVFMRLTTAFTLDSTFDGDGKIDDFNLSFPFDARAVAVQPDGKVVWAGSVEQSLFGVPNVSFVVGRFLANGAPDPSFDGDGYRAVLFDVGGSLADYAEAVAVQADGKVVVVGRAFTGPSSADFAIARLDVDGSLDTTFSGDGKLLVGFGGYDTGDSVAIDRFGRIVVAGAADFFDLGVVRLLPDGTFDPSFGVGGKAQLEIGSGNGRRSLVLLPGDALLVASDFDPGGADLMDNYVAVLEPDGDLDLTFGGGDGTVTYASLPFVADPQTSFKAAAAHAGKVLVAGDASNEQPDIGFAVRLWMSRLFRDDFETGNLLMWSADSP